MKKHAALLLALLFALGLAAPSLAYTNNAALQQGVSPYTVDIYLVEYADGDQLSSWLSMPPADRGYAKNEVIAAIGALTVPADRSVYSDYYNMLIFSGKNVSLEIIENKLYGGGVLTYAELTSSMKASVPGWWDDLWATLDGDLLHFLDGESDQAVADRRIALNSGVATLDCAIPVSSVEKTYRFLVFGKVTDDDASLTFSLSRYESFFPTEIAGVIFGWLPANWAGLAPHISLADPAATPTLGMVLNEDLVVYSQASPSGYALIPRGSFAVDNVYYVFENALQSLNFEFLPAVIPASTPGQLLFAIETGARGKTERLYMYPHGAGTGSTEYRVHVEPSTQELVFIITMHPPAGKAVNDQIKFGTAGYNSLLAFYKDWFEDKLGFTAYNEGNLLGWDDWYAIADAAIDISATVEIEPWTPYVSVPDNIVTDPPKTGSAGAPYVVYGVALVACAAGLWACARKRAMGN